MYTWTFLTLTLSEQLIATTVLLAGFRQALAAPPVPEGGMTACGLAATTWFHCAGATALTARATRAKRIFEYMEVSLKARGSEPSGIQMSSTSPKEQTSEFQRREAPGHPERGETA